VARLAGNIKVRWACEKVKGKYTVRQIRYEVTEDPLDPAKKTRKRVEENVQKDRGWMVYFPAGHSLHIPTREEMIARGFMDEEGNLAKAGLVDMATGLPVDLEADPLQQLKRIVQRSTRDDFASHLEE
jgi:hypothetical protein